MCAAMFVSQAGLALAVTEFIFFPVPGMDLYFGFVLNMGLVMWRCFLLPHWQSSVGRWKETQPGQETPADQRDVPDHATPCSVDKLQGEKQGSGGCLE